MSSVAVTKVVRTTAIALTEPPGAASGVWSVTKTWTDDLHGSNGHHTSDIRKDSPLTLRSDGTAHFKMLCDSDDTWNMVWFFHVDGQPDWAIPDFGIYYVYDKNHREHDFPWVAADKADSYLRAGVSVTMAGHI